MPFVIDHLPAGITLVDLADKERDLLRMSFEERRWVRRRVISANGREIALALPTGTVLAPHSILLVERSWYLEVEAVAEPVLSVTPRTAADSIRAAFEIGNHHFPLGLSGETLLVPDAGGVIRLLNRLGIPWTRMMAVFDPLGGGHSHGT